MVPDQFTSTETFPTRAPVEPVITIDDRVFTLEVEVDQLKELVAGFVASVGRLVERLENAGQGFVVPEVEGSVAATSEDDYVGVPA